MSDMLTDIGAVTILMLFIGWWLHGPFQEEWNWDGKQKTVRQNLRFWGIIAVIAAALAVLLILGWTKVVFAVLLAAAILFTVGLALALAHWRA